MKGVFAWLGRTGLLYAVLCGAIAFYILAWPAITQRMAGSDFRQDIMSIAEIREELAADRLSAQAALDARATAIRTDSHATLTKRLRAVRAENAQIADRLADADGWLASIQPSRILARKRLELRAAALTAEAEALDMALEARKRQAILVAAEQRLRDYPRVPTQRAIDTADGLCRQARGSLDIFERRNRADRTVREMFLGERERLRMVRDDRCGQATRLAEFRKQGLAANRQVAKVRQRLADARAWTMDTLPDPARTLSDTTIRDVLVRAAVALALIVLTPFFIRTLFYYALAPMAQARPPIRLTGSSSVPIAADKHGVSRPSITVVLDKGEELLVRQSFLQSSDSRAAMRTRKLLDWRSPLTSLASGMAFLTQARRATGLAARKGEADHDMAGGDKTGQAAATFGISARDDPFAEIARIDLPPGAALVLHPRALAAVIQPIDRPLQIRSRWRVFSLHAWLTFQFRYLVFHGPVALIVKGGRGVRIEPAETGRMFGQDQLLGFSAHTAYSIRRSETFLPYLFGREPLFRDQVADIGHGTPGVLVIEEAPMSGRSRGIRGGLEGAMDAVLKAFGI